MNVFEPVDGGEAGEIVRAARSDNTTLRIEGGGTRGGLGRPVQAHDILSTRRLSGILIYEPSEMVLRVRAGTPLSEIETALESNGQMLPFEPADYRRIFDSRGEPSIGALAACNISGPRRLRAGAARDAMIGVRFVNGAGEELSSGGRVMKNVTGLDLVKLQAGAFGTLGLLTEVTFKLLPRPECTGTLVIEGLDSSNAIAAMSAALRSPFEVSGAAYLPAMEGGPVSRTAIRIEHFRNSVDYRSGELACQLSEYGTAVVMGDEPSRRLWAELRDVTALSASVEDVIWRVSLRPSMAKTFLGTIEAAGVEFRYLLDHGGGLIWLAVPAEDDACAHLVRNAIPHGAGHAMMFRAPDALRSSLDVFQPLSRPVMQLTAGIKASIDASGIFNPGRMYAGI